MQAVIAALGAYPELNPVRSALPLLLRGLRAPRIETACELGFAQGVVASAQEAEAAARGAGTARALNLERARRAAEATNLGFLASPVTGGAAGPGGRLADTGPPCWRGLGI